MLELAWRHPQLVAGLVCVDGGVIDLRGRFDSFAEASRVLAPPALTGMRGEDLEAQMRATHADWAEWAIDAAMANFQRRSDGTVAPWLGHDHHMAVLEGLWHHRPLDRFAALAVPALLLMADDGTASTWAADKRATVDAALANPFVEARWFEPADHDLHAQLPGQVAAAVHGAALAWSKVRAPASHSSAGRVARADRSPGRCGGLGAS